MNLDIPAMQLTVEEEDAASDGCNHPIMRACPLALEAQIAKVLREELKWLASNPFPYALNAKNAIAQQMQRAGIEVDK